MILIMEEKTMKQILRIFILTAMVSTVWSQTTGKISGTVQADDGTPLAGADVVVVGTGKSCAPLPPRRPSFRNRKD